jgi:Rrf2 family iron-sulfur cluster assembly transcriptional regulator
MTPSKFYEGLEAVVYIALNSGAHPVSSKEVANSQGVLPRHLEPVMQLLVHNGILRGTKGPKGGYTLAMEKRKITVGKIFRVFLDKVSSDANVSLLKIKIISPLNEMAEDSLLQLFDKITIEDLCKKATNTVGAQKESGHFNI